MDASGVVESAGTAEELLPDMEGAWRGGLQRAQRIDRTRADDFESDDSR